MYTIPTLTDMRRHLQLAPSDASADDQLLRALQDASHYLESATQRRYCPRLATLDARVDASAPDQLILPDDLLELRAITGSDQGNIALTRARRIPQSADAPASVLRVAETFSDSLRIEGIWGWHDRWTNAWRDSGDRPRQRDRGQRGEHIRVRCGWRRRKRREPALPGRAVAARQR